MYWKIEYLINNKYQFPCKILADLLLNNEKVSNNNE